MKPGRDMDALVAVKVMGWKFCWGFTRCPDLQSDRWAVDPLGHERFFREIPRYSTNISAAWKVLTHLQFTHWRIEVYRIQESEEWGCSLSQQPFRSVLKDIDVCVTAGSAPHAICLAALKATGHEL